MGKVYEDVRGEYAVVVIAKTELGSWDGFVLWDDLGDWEPGTIIFLTKGDFKDRLRRLA